jgi:hypothetical protein
MGARIRITRSVWEALRRHHTDPSVKRERISYLFGRSVRGRDGIETILLATPPILPSDDCFIDQSGGHVRLDPQVLNAVMAAFARTDCNTFVNVHDHWFARSGTDFSAVDTRDDLRLSDYLRRRFEPMLRRRPDIGRARGVVSLSLVLDQEGLAARYVDRRGRFCRVESVDVIGAPAMRIQCNGGAEPRPGEDVSLARQRDFMNVEQARFLAGSTIGIVGCGGLGSIAGEALLRLGARRFVLFDDDSLEPHNLNRWQGGTTRDVGRSKPALLATRLRKLGPPGAVKARAVKLSVLEPLAMPALRRCDLLVGCVDNHLARSFINRFAVQYLVPLFDAGVNISIDPNVDFASRYYGVLPGSTACAECTAYDLLNQPRIEHALIDPVTAAERRKAGYVDEHPEISSAASAYPLNMRAVATLAQELLNWIGGYRPFGTCVFEAWRGGRYQRSDRANHPEGPDPACVTCALLLGAGDHADLPRPRAAGHAARILAEARTQLTISPARKSVAAI